MKKKEMKINKAKTRNEKGERRRLKKTVNGCEGEGY